MEFGIFNEIITDDEYGIDTMPEVKTILDIGANIGMYCITVAKKFPNAKIIAVEPSSDTYKRLLHNISESGVKNITAIKKAVAGSAGKAELYMDANPGSSSLYMYDAPDKETVETITLDSLLSAYHPDIIKLDAEGAEYEILKNRIPESKFLVLEIHPILGGSIKELVKKLETKYDVTRLPGTNVYRCSKKS